MCLSQVSQVHRLVNTLKNEFFKLIKDDLNDEKYALFYRSTHYKWEKLSGLN